MEAAFNEALARIDTEVADDPKLQVDLLDDFGEVLANQGRFDEAKALFGRALALAETQYPADNPVIAETLVNQVAINQMVGTTLLAAPAAERAFEIFRKHQQTLPMHYANAVSALMVMRDAQGRPEEALALALEVLELTRRHREADSRPDALFAALNSVASVLLNLGRHAEAEPFAREAVVEAERLGGGGAPIVGAALNGLQMIVYRLGRYDEAQQIAQLRVKIARAAFGDRHPMTADALRDLAWVEEELGHFDAAQKHFDTAIEVMRETDSEEPIPALRMRALFRRNRGDAAGALADFEAGIAQCIERRPDHVICQVLRANRAGHIARMGRGAEALRESDAVLAILERMQRVEGNEYAQALESRALALNAIGRADGARETQQRAIDRYIALFGEEHREAQRARKNLKQLGEPATGELQSVEAEIR